MKDCEPRILFLSVTDGYSRVKTIIGKGFGLQMALNQAIDIIHRDFTALVKSMIGIKVDVVNAMTFLKAVDLSKPFSLNKSFWGLAFDDSFPIALLPGQCQGYRIIDSKNQFRQKSLQRYLKQQGFDLKLPKAIRGKQKADLFGFQCQSFYVTKKSEVVALYRDHRRYSKLTRTLLMSAALKGGRYLQNALDEQGRFAYSYKPLQDDVPDKYNVLRHAGSIYAMLELYEITKDETLLTAARKAIGHLQNFIKPIQVNKKKSACVVEDNWIKLGGNALALLALGQYQRLSGDSTYLVLMRQLALWICSVQADSGQFTVFKQDYQTGVVADFVSGYYPGEAIFALGRFYQLDPDKRWLDVAERGANYLIQQSRAFTLEQTVHDHWLLYGMRQLFKLAPDTIYIDHSMKIAQAIMLSQLKNCKRTDWNGGFYRPPRSTPTAIRLEGLCCAYELALISENNSMQKQIMRTLIDGTKFLLQTQYTIESAMYLPNPKRVLGGFRQSLTVYETRIDYVQHAISALVGLWRLLPDKTLMP